MDNNQQYNQQYDQQYTPQMTPPQQKIVMVTPYSVADDNNNPRAKSLIFAAVICMCISKFSPAFSAMFMAVDRYADMPSIPISFNFLFFIAAIVILIIVKVQYPQNSIAKGLLIGLVANAVISALTAAGALAAIFGILSAYSPADFSDFVWELMDILGL